MGFTCEVSQFYVTIIMVSSKYGYLVVEMRHIFFRELRERLYRSFCHGWRNHLESSDKLSLYGQHKNYLERETYIDIL